MVTVYKNRYYYCLPICLALSVYGFSMPAGYPVDLAEIISLLRSPEESTQTRGIAAASSLGAKANGAVPDLLRLLREGDEKMRAHATFALGNIAPDAEDVVPELISRLSDPSAEVRSYASAAISKAGKVAVPRIIRVASGPSLEARLSAIRALGMVRPIAEEALPLLVKLLVKEPERASARHALCAMGEAAIPELKKAAGASDGHLRLRAIETFTCMRGETVTFAPEIISALRDPDRKVRKAAMAALPMIGPDVKDAAPALIEGLRDQDLEMKRSVVRGMRVVSSGLEGAVPGLTTNLSSPDKEIRTESARVLAAIGPAAISSVPALKKMERDPDVFVAEAARVALRRIRVNAWESTANRISESPGKVGGVGQTTGGVFSIVAPVGLFDKLPPVVTLESDSRFEEGGKTYFSGKVPVNVKATDIGSNDAIAGVATTYFLLDEQNPAACLRKPYNQTARAGTCSNPIYREPVIFPEGIHKVHYWAADKAGNVGKITAMEISVDGIPPTTELKINGKAVLAGTTIYAEPRDIFSLTATDHVLNRAASGLKVVYLLIDTSLEECSYANELFSGGIDGVGSCEDYIYSGPFRMPEGEHIIYYQAEDNIGNVGEVRTVSVIVRDTAR